MRRDDANAHRDQQVHLCVRARERVCAPACVRMGPRLRYDCRVDTSVMSRALTSDSDRNRTMPLNIRKSVAIIAPA